VAAESLREKRLEAGVADGPALDFNVEIKARAEFFENLGQKGNPFAGKGGLLPRAYVQGREEGKVRVLDLEGSRSPSRLAWPIHLPVLPTRDPFRRIVMDHGELSVPRKVHIELDAWNPRLPGGPECGHGILRV